MRFHSFISLFTGFTVSLSSPVPRATVCPSTEGDAPFSLPCTTYSSTITCPNGIQGKKGGVVLLVHGTTLTGEESWENGPYITLLPSEGEGFDVCWIDLPNRSMGDAQITAEYIAYAIPYLAKQSATGQMSIVGHSQGAGLNPQWALLFWPSTRAYVEDYVGLAADFHGTAEGPLACVALDLLEGGCEASILQQTVGSHYLAAQNSKGNEAFVTTTSIYTIYDDIIQPEVGTGATSILPGATNIILQDTAVCGPGHIVDHLGIPADAPAYYLAVDALTHPGPASVARFNQTLCNWLVDAALIAQYNEIPLVLNEVRGGVSHTLHHLVLQAGRRRESQPTSTRRAYE